MKLVLICFLVTIEFDECHDQFYFFEPQPVIGKELLSFPSTLTGHYGGYVANVSIDIQIGDSLIIVKVTEDYSRTGKGHSDSVQEARFMIDTLERIGVKALAYQSFNRIHDSSKQSAPDVDTVFRFSKKTSLRVYNNIFFLNYLEGDSLWYVESLQIRQDTLFISSLSLNGDFETLYDMKVFSIDTHHVRWKPTGEQFAAFLLRGAFHRKELAFYRLH